MKFKVGQLVWIASSFNAKEVYDPPALIIAAYIDEPRIFPNNKEANKIWLEAEDISAGWVYDIIHNGKIEFAILGEWLRPFEISSC